MNQYDFKTAEEYLKTYLQKAGPVDSAFYGSFMYGKWHEKQGYLVDAFAYYQRALNETKDWNKQDSCCTAIAGLYQKIGKEVRKNKQYLLALEALKEADKLLSLQKNNLTEKHIKSIEALIKNKHAKASIYAHLEQTEAEEREYNEIEQILEEMISSRLLQNIAPESELLQQMGYLYYQKGNMCFWNKNSTACIPLLETAYQWYQQALHYVNNAQNVKSQKCWLHHYMGDVCQTLQKNNIYFYGIGQGKNHWGKKAFQHYQQIIACNTNPKTGLEYIPYGNYGMVDLLTHNQLLFNDKNSLKTKQDIQFYLKQTLSSLSLLPDTLYVKQKILSNLYGYLRFTNPDLAKQVPLIQAKSYYKKK